jgi:hypothetical protein
MTVAFACTVEERGMVKMNHGGSVGQGSPDGKPRYNVRARGITEVDEGTWRAEWDITDRFTGSRTRICRRFSAKGIEEAKLHRDVLTPTIEDRIIAGDFWPLMAEVYLALARLTVSRDDYTEMVSEVTKALPHVAESPVAKLFCLRFNKTTEGSLVEALVEGGVERPMAEEFSEIVLNRVLRKTKDGDAPADPLSDVNGFVNLDRSLVCPLTKNGIEKLGELLDRSAMGMVGEGLGDDMLLPAMCSAASWVHLLTGLPVESVLSLKAEDVDLAQRKAIVRRKLVPIKTTGDWTCFEANECRPRHCTWPRGLAPVFEWLLSKALPDGWLFYRGDPNAPIRLLQEDLNQWGSRALRPLLDQLDGKYSANPMKFLRIVYTSTMYDHGHTRYQIESRIGYCSFTRDWPLKEPPRNDERAGALYVTAQEFLCSPSPSIWRDLAKDVR